MTQNYTSELHRALARKDVAELERLAAVHAEYAMNNSHEYYEAHSKAIDDWMHSPFDDPDKALALTMISASRYDDPKVLVMVAVGILEDLLRQPSDAMIDRIVAEARKTERLRWMLSGVFPHAMSPGAWNAVKPFVTGMTTDGPVPPRP